MADGTQLNQASTSGDDILTDDLSVANPLTTQKVEVTKEAFGPDNTVTRVEDGIGKRLPVKIGIDEENTML